MYVKVILLPARIQVYTGILTLYNNKRMARRVRECVQGRKYDLI